MNKKHFFLLFLLFLFHLFFRFYHLERWASFTWDQIDNAWAAVRILVAHKYPLVGMVAKANSGIYIGPFYYYLVAVFYAITQLDPIASPLLAGFTGLFNFIVLYYVAKRLFDENIALISSCIYTFSSYIIFFERSQWPVNFIPSFSLLILYFLYGAVTEKPKHILYLGFVLALSFHIHVTSLFFLIITLLSLPLVSFHKTKIAYLAVAACILGAGLIPQALYYAHSGGRRAGSINTYIGQYYHGFHLMRFFQLTHDAFIKFVSILEFPYGFLRSSGFLYLPLFFILHRTRHTGDNAKKLRYLVLLWFIVPWILFTAYSGEISDYYFSLHLYIAIIILAYISHWIWARKLIVTKAAVVIFWMYYVVTNTQKFFLAAEGNLTKDRRLVKQAIKEGKTIGFSDGNPQSYLYFYYLYTQSGISPYQL